jgi:hypothetical protein
MWGFTTHAECKRAIARLEEDLEKHRGEQKRLRLEWEDTYDRLKRMMGRIAKRSAIVDAQTDSQNQEEQDGVVPLPAPTGSSWTPKMIAQQNAILARRRAGIPNA